MRNMRPVPPAEVLRLRAPPAARESPTPFREAHLESLDSESHYTSPYALYSALFAKGSADRDVCGCTVVVSDSHDEKVVFYLKSFFPHLNIVYTDTVDTAQVAAHVDRYLGGRLKRVQTWTGTGDFNIDNHYDVPCIFPGFQGISTMSNELIHSTNKPPGTTKRIIAAKDDLLGRVDFVGLLGLSPQRQADLCHFVGHWLFPAHELSIDDLVYCAYVMLKYALDLAGLHFSANQLVAFVTMTRDTYRNGNPFHNFRHAVDVLQACFHFLVRLGCLPQFEQLEQDPRKEAAAPFALRTQCPEHLVARGGTSLHHLSVTECAGLLVAALGHDVGHPGVTNAFLIKHNAPVLQVFSDRSVLELFHLAVFVNKLLSVHMPQLLDAKLPLKKLIVGSILATDMAEHFEYVHKLQALRLDGGALDRVTLISSLLIKCADISNVSRPLRVSAQWALVLLREFDEVERLDTGDVGEVAYSKLPRDLEDVLAQTPGLHRGQLFFINTFAEDLFSGILELLPELQYTHDIVRENKAYWEGK